MRQSPRKRIALIGSTGSIGRSALDVVRKHPGRFEVVALAASSRAGRLAEQAAEFKPRYAALADGAAGRNADLSGSGAKLLLGAEAVAEIAALAEVDIVLVAAVGIAGLAPALAAVRAGKRLALATKEVLVAAGPLLLAEARKSGAEILPVDSEHSAIFQCLQSAGARGSESVERLILTASGGPFRTAAREKLARVTPAEALAHPTWTMGSKITIDSATLMNKGLEVIEARWLFDIPPARIDVVIHPQSVVHSLVEFTDGACVAQLGTPDMRVPIAYALTYPERWPLDVPRLDLAKLRELTFAAPDHEAFPCLGLAFEALKRGGTAPAVLNATNEVAVTRFLDGTIGFLDIPRIVEAVLNMHTIVSQPAIADVIDADTWAREQARSVSKAHQAPGNRS